MASAIDIQNLYIAYFNRPADVAGLAYWTSGTQANYTMVQIAQLFSQQVEYASVFANSTASQTINALYHNLFSHDADTSGLAYWSGQINNGTFTIGQVAIAILTGATGTDAATIAAKFAAANSFSNRMATNISAQMAYNPTSGNAYGIAKNWLAGVVDTASGVAATSTLDTTLAAITTVANTAVIVNSALPITVNPGVANLGTAGNDTFTATDATLMTAGTSINGNGGTDVLSVTSLLTDGVHPTTVTGVPTLNLQLGAQMEKAVTFMNQFTTIHDNNAAGGDVLYLGTVAQTLNLYNTSGWQEVSLGAPHQVVNLVTAGSGNVCILAHMTDLASATFNFNNGIGANKLILTDFFSTATLTLSAAQTSLFGAIETWGVSLNLSPVNDITVYSYGMDASIVSSTDKRIFVDQGIDQRLVLDGIANYSVSMLGPGMVIDNGKAGLLDVYTTASANTIVSSVATAINMADSGTGNETDTLNGTGNFTVNFLGTRAHGKILDGGALTGKLTVNTYGTYSATVTEADSTGVVNVSLLGSGVLTLNTTETHLTAVNAEGDHTTGKIALTGKGNVSIHVEIWSSLTVTGGAGLETINLAASGDGVDNISVGTSTLGNIATNLITINNFKATGADVLHLGHAATSLGTINITSSDFASLAGNITSSAGALTNNDYKAFMVNVAGGAAAGTYVYEHTAGAGDIIVKLTGTTGTVAAGDLQV